MKLEINQLRYLARELLLGVLHYASPLGMLRELYPQPVSAPVRAADSLAILVMDCGLPWTARLLTVPQATAGIGTALAEQYWLRYLLKHNSFRHQVEGNKPLSILFCGRLLPKSHRTVRVSEDEICWRLLGQGIRSTFDLYVVVMEPSCLLSWTKSALGPTIMKRSGLMR